MTITRWRVFWLWQFEEEEKWLNEMSGQGWQLQHVGFCNYTFKKGEPGEYIYRLELLDNPKSFDDSVRYISFIEDTRAEQICNISRWVYFRKKTELGGFDLFSDIDSRIKHLNRILLIAGIAWMINFMNFVLQLNTWQKLRERTSLVIFSICLLAAIFFGIGFLIIMRKKNRLKKEKLLRE